MRLGSYEHRKAALQALFGDHYTDDNAVILMEGDQQTVAYLSPTSQPDELLVTWCNSDRVAFIHVPGAGKEPHEL